MHPYINCQHGLNDELVKNIKYHPRLSSLASVESIKTGAKWQAACVSFCRDFQSSESCIKQFFIVADKCIIIPDKLWVIFLR
ncbi:MAG: hypothetical protein CL909_05310 [Deltaproteobacteria bacterium]|jgi:hypothetical protein|nr:hypothetical protein [Deltaproteobacteria bacterium]MAF55479.1 hypothetical protein [Deltaproteobacteria bacterium]